MTSQSGGSRFSGNQYGANQGSASGEFGSNQGSRSQYGSQSSGGSTSHGSGQYGQNGGYGTQTYNKTWTSTGQGLTAEEQEQFRKNLQNTAAVQRQGNYQGSYSQGDNTQGGSRGGYGRGGEIVRMKNRTIIYDENHNIVSQTETSTEYGSLGHEGEEGSSFNL